MRVCAVALVALAVTAASGTAATGRVAELRFHLVDRTRVAHYRSGAVGPRVLVTYVRYPTGKPGPLPLIVFAHGFRSTPRKYASLLDAWARAGYVVATPVFPVENADAPGGPDERDLVNQPADMRFVITQLLASGRLRGLVDPAAIAVAGQSDGAETAYAVAGERGYRDPRVRAAVVLSGAELPGGKPGDGPPLLAVQGMRDTINEPRYSLQLFADAARPKFLLELLGAGHIEPYTTNRRQLALVERVSLAFLDRYLGHGSMQQLLAAARAPGAARLIVG